MRRIKGDFADEITGTLIEYDEPVDSLIVGIPSGVPAVDDRSV